MAILAALALSGCNRSGSEAPTASPDAQLDAQAGAAIFVGSESCAICHAPEATEWKGSQHALAMRHATPETVLGDFDDAKFRHFDVTSTFFRRDGKYFVRTDGPDGQLADFEVKYTFGLDPLQQYLVELPRGHLQALTMAWDARPRSEGGQRWFHLIPDERIDWKDELHWTRRAQNWNYMCADCHSTNLQKGYDAKSDSYATTWSEIHVGCEACHGPGSRHVAWMKEGGRAGHSGFAAKLDERRGVSWTMDVAKSHAIRSTPRTSSREIEVCAQCHSRRTQIADDYHAGAAFLDHYLPALPNAPLYWADGQQRDEVYIHASFLQSKMNAAGVTCSDCHEPHSAKLRFEGNALCAQCHVAARYDTPAHHFHAQGSPGAECANCHMPETTYMGIDPRRDHGFRIPHPERTAIDGSPSACTNCHVKQDAAWAAAALDRWLPNRKRDTGGGSDVEVARAATTPGILRAAAVERIGRAEPSLATANVAAEAARDADALLRLASADLAQAMSPPERLTIYGPLLADSRRAVRISAAEALADIPAEQFPAELNSAWAKASGEYVETQRYNADRPESWVNLGTFLARQGDAAGAGTAFERAIALDPAFAPAYVNAADALRAQQRDVEGLAVLDRGVAALAKAGAPEANAAALHYARGLALVRLQRLSEALGPLKKAHELAPDDERYRYVYEVACEESGQCAR